MHTLVFKRLRIFRTRIRQFGLGVLKFRPTRVGLEGIFDEPADDFTIYQK